MDVNDSATLRFNGTGVSFIMYTDEWSGIASIVVDGVAQGEVDAYAAPSKGRPMSTPFPT